jgi:OmpA-OmpF porin, OOP family
MHKNMINLVLLLVFSMLSTSFMAGCAHMEKSPPERGTGFLYIHKPLPEASRKIDEARRAGKDQQCPEEFKAAKDTVDDAYATYLACHTKEGIAKAQQGISMANALCPPKPVAVVPVPVPVPVPAPEHYKYCETLHIEFDVDRAVVRPEYRDEIAKVGDFMKKYPTTTAVIEGHTDNVGNYDHNMDLSQRRAQAVVDYLVDNFGIDRSRLTAKGYGYTRPIADNATQEGRQKNRRIEALIDCAFDVRQIQPPEKLCMQLVLDFDSGKSDLKPGYRDQIAKVADYMKQYPTTTAVIEGHTDNVGDPDYNMKLSQRRAETVVNTLVNDFGIDRSRLTAKGYGSTRSISYNDTPEGRALNRRINAVIDCVIKK